MAVAEIARPKTEKVNKKGDFLKEYVTRLDNETVHFLDMRLKHRLTGDLADAVNLLSKTADMDRYLAGAKSADEFYDMLDSIQKYAERESRRRHG